MSNQPTCCHVNQHSIFVKDRYVAPYTSRVIHHCPTEKRVGTMVEHMVPGDGLLQLKNPVCLYCEPGRSRPSSRSMNSNIVSTVPEVGKPISARRSFKRWVLASRHPSLVMNAFHTSISSSLGLRYGQAPFRQERIHRCRLCGFQLRARRNQCAGTCSSGNREVVSRSRPAMTASLPGNFPAVASRICPTCAQK